jgi:ATP-dependent protease ClpP protease subunit
MPVELNIFGNIGDFKGQNKDAVKEVLDSAMGQDVLVNISSSGGSVFEGLAIAAILSEYSGKTTAKGLGIVASAATIVMLACNEKAMTKNSFFMMHNSWGRDEGNAGEMERTVELLKKVDEQMAQIYTTQIESKGKLKEGDREKTLKMVKKMMQDETWLTADEALAIGFIDKVVEEDIKDAQLYKDTYAYVRAEANFKNIPKQIQSMTAEKKTLLQQMAEWLGLKAEISNADLVETVLTEADPIPEPKIENAPEQKTDSKEEELETKLAELLKKVEEKQKQLEEIEANIASKISYKSEPKAEKTGDSVGFTQDQILQASKFINSLIQK